jgi:hypothetical protein
MRSRTRAIADLLTDEVTPLRLSLLILLMRPASEGTVRGFTWLIAGLALALPPLARSSLTWLALAGLVLARVVLDWPLSDNHIYLLGYWCLGLGLCLPLSSPFAAVAEMGRWLVGGAFLCAIVWKGVLAPDFLDARFFRVTLVTDERFEGLSRSVGGLTDAQLEANRAALVALPQGAELLDGPVLMEPAALRRLGLTLTWGGFLLEALVAAAFLSRRPSLLHRNRHVLLIAFVGLTYAAAPVAGFGWLLAAMGLAQCEPEQRAIRLAYVAAFVIVTIYAETPAVQFVLGAMGPDPA